MTYQTEMKLLGLTDSDASKHINLTSERMGLDRNSHLKVEAAHLGVRLGMFARTALRVLIDRGLELYLLVIPFLILVVSL